MPSLVAVVYRLSWPVYADPRVAGLCRSLTTGLQLQVDFGSTHVQVGEELTRVFLFVATLGYSRRTCVLLSLHEC